VQKSAFVVDDQKDPGRDFDGVLSLPALGFKEVAFDFQRHCRAEPIGPHRSPR
jgi:hypothetical protein